MKHCIKPNTLSGKIPVRISQATPGAACAHDNTQYTFVNMRISSAITENEHTRRTEAARLVSSSISGGSVTAASSLGSSAESADETGGSAVAIADLRPAALAGGAADARSLHSPGPPRCNQRGCAAAPGVHRRAGELHAALCCSGRNERAEGAGPRQCAGSAGAAEEPSSAGGMPQGPSCVPGECVLTRE